MKRILITLAALLLCMNSLMAIPAHPGTSTVQQPDGSVLTLRLLGDEWLHFNTTADGFTVVRDARGYYVYADVLNGQLVATAQVAHDAGQRQQAEQAFLANRQKYMAPAMSAQNVRTRDNLRKRQQQMLSARRAAQYDYNNFKGLIILVQFTDKQFSRSDYPTIINDMVNQENYTGYTATNGHKENYTGSVRDYFNDNSGGKFQPQFDIVGPYTVDYSQYDGGDQAFDIACAALEAADPDVDYSQYDGDGDGIVDLVYFILAGNGANYGGNDSRLWWPHRSAVYDRYTWSWLVKDDIVIYDYASSTELSGYTAYPYTVKIDGIGTICHEFSHVLGLPDFYDTNYEEQGRSNDPGIWSVMAGGSYENDARTPVGYSLYERYSVGFIDDVPLIDAEGSYTLEALHSSQNGLRINSSVDNEFFMLENRQKGSFKWDAYLPGSGMLVHRVDLTNMNAWENNTVNSNPTHNYYEVLRAGGASRSGTAHDLFPGTSNVTALHNTTWPANLKTWGGKSTKWGLENIKMNGGVITFDVMNTFILESISLPETSTVVIGLPLKLTATLEPSYVDCELTWTSDDEAVATVDADGTVHGVAPGVCNITVTAENGMTASCQVTAENPTAVSVADFKAQETGTQMLLQLTDAQVLYVNKKVVYVRDATGPVVLNNIGFTLKQNQVISGTLFAEVGVENGMVQVVPISGVTNADDLTITTGEAVQPREVQLENLTADDYADYIIVKDVPMEIGSGYWVFSGDKRVRLWNLFRVKGVVIPNNLQDKTFDVEGIFGTDVVDGAIVDELYLLSSVIEHQTETSVPKVFSTTGADDADAPAYNLQGLPVDSRQPARGLIIRNGKKYIRK